MTVALLAGAPIALVMPALVHRRKPLVIPAVVFAAITIAATAISVLSGFFGDPAALVVAAPVLAAAIVIRVPLAREQLGLSMALLMLGWLGGIVSLTLVDPVNMSHFRAAFVQGESERLDALTAGGATVGRDGVLADVDNAPAFLLGRGRARGILGPQSEPFALAMLFARIDAPFVAVPDPQSNTGVNDRINKAFPSLFREGARGYRVVYQNNTWRLFSLEK